MSKTVHDMFAKIARRYDIANDVLSFGIHRLWRRRLVSLLALRAGADILDLCTGTGDLALLLAQKAGPGGKVVGLDFVEPMLELARKKQAASGISQISFLRGDAMRIPFPDNSFDAVTIAFGIRNVDDPGACLEEIGRVLRPGGKLGVLEFGQPTVPGFSAAYRFYSKHLMPLIGGSITGDRKAYVYLPETSSKFPSGTMFERIIGERQYANIASRSLFCGIAYIYTAEKPAKLPSEAVSGKNERISVETGAQQAG